MTGTAALKSSDPRAGGHLPSALSVEEARAEGHPLSGSVHGEDQIPYTLSDDVFFLFSELICSASGIRLGLKKKELLISRLMKRLKALRIRGFYNYYRRLRSDNEELIEMLNCITTNTTDFFREKYHFEYLKNVLIPDMVKTKSQPMLAIWSAGCSTGEEPYSIAVSVCEALRQCKEPAGKWDTKILATDIATNVLETARTGIYERDQLPDNMPQDMLQRYFLNGTGEHEGKIKVKDEMKRMIRFRRLNLKDGLYPFKNTFDIIFCRNVMIYFDEDMKQHLIAQFHRYLSAEGYLFLGHSETMLGRTQFIPVYITLYKRN